MKSFPGRQSYLPPACQALGLPGARRLLRGEEEAVLKRVPKSVIEDFSWILVPERRNVAVAT